MTSITNDATTQHARICPVGKILVVAGVGATRRNLLAELSDLGHDCAFVDTVSDAKTTLEHGAYDLVLLDLDEPNNEPLELFGHLRAAKVTSKIIGLSRHESYRQAVEALRCGAIDMLTLPIEREQLRERMVAALRRAKWDRTREQRVSRLRHVCRQLNNARHEIAEQVDFLSNDLVSAYHELLEHLDHVALSSEFKTLLNQELDVEGLLRTTLEYLLTKTGPTNAAVFLPDGDGDFSLGAYVNTDCPQDNTNGLLEKLGERVCPQMLEEPDIIEFTDAKEFCNWIGGEADFLRQSRIIALACHHEGECMAVVVLFRDNSHAFSDELPPTLNVLRPIFAEQLSTVVRIHQRGKDEWPDEAANDELEFGDEFGFGGLAA